MSNAVWKPQPKQALFMSRNENECLYGGSAGGGKSDALLAEATRQVHIPTYRGIIFRRTYPQLKKLIDRSYQIYTRAFPKAKYNSGTHTWVFPSGAKIYLANMNRESDKYNYQGQDYEYIAFDELTQFTEDQYIYMLSRNRPNGPNTRCYMRATANPGGIGHGWVKQRFLTPAPPMTRITEDVSFVDDKGNLITKTTSRIFIPSNVFDNKELLKNDPTYLARLAMLPEKDRNALLYGDWDSFDGQVFTEWINDSKHYKDGKYTHVIEPFKVPPHWLIYRGFDFGYAKPFSVGWYAVDTEGKIYRIREYYGCTGNANEGLKITPQEIAKNIKEIEDTDENLKGKNIIGVADPSIFDRSRGESVADMMASHPYYVTWSKGDNTRIAGKMQFHYRFAFDNDGEPMFQVFNTCKHFIRTIPLLIYDEHKVEDIDTEMEDHIYDECRYVLMTNPISPRQNLMKPCRIIPGDPLNQMNNKVR